MKIKLLFILFTFLIQTISFSQQKLGIKAGIGFSRLSTNHNTNSIYVGNYSEISDEIKLSGQLGVYYSYDFNNKYYLGSELLFMQIETEQKIKYYQNSNPLDNLTSTNNYTVNDEQNISYIGLPVYIGVNLNKMKIDLGIQVNYLIGSKGKTVGEGTNYGQGITYDNLNINNLDYGPRIGASVNLTQNIWIEGNYYYGMKNINKTYEKKWKVRQFTISLKFDFIKLN